MTRVTAGTFVRPIVGETVAGDACLVDACACGVVVAVVDGLGHGPAAAAASSAFLECLRAHRDEPLPEIFAIAHRAMLKTRGAVAVVARFDEAAGRVELAGLGNVTVLLAGHGADPKHVVVPPGVVGGTFRTIRSHVDPFAPGDVLVMHTDGVRSRFDWRLPGCPSPADLAQTIVAQHGKTTDDAGCAVVIGTTSVPPSPAAPDRDGHDAVQIAIRTPGDAECCAVEARAFAGRCGFDVESQWELAIAVSELVTNVLKFATEGTLTITYARHAGHRADARDRVVIEVVDRGSGFAGRALRVARQLTTGAAPGTIDADLHAARRPGQSLGVGLACVRRMTDHVIIESSGAGSRVVALKYRR